MANPTPKTIPSRRATAGTAFTWTAATGSQQSIPWMPGGILLAWNTDGSNAYTVTVVNNPKNSRDTNTITAESLAAGIFHVFPRFAAQDNDVLLVTGSNAAMKFAVLDTRAQPA